MPIECIYCGVMVWVPSDDGLAMLNGEKKCKCPKCSKGKVWTTYGKECDIDE